MPPTSCPSSIAGYGNVATADVAAVLVPPGDVSALARALRRVVDDHDLAATLVANGNARADDFAMSTLAAAYVGIYDRLANGGVD